MTVSALVVSSTIELLRPDRLGPVLVLYVGPDQILPLTSLLGAILGLLLIFWRYVVHLAGKVWQLLFRR
jgi:hypothetical protein